MNGVGYPDDYNELREHIVNNAENYLTNQHLNTLINGFKTKINSTRRSSYIRNFNELINLLEKRACVGDENVAVFQCIINMFPDPNVSTDIMLRYHTSRTTDRRQLNKSGFHSYQQHSSHNQPTSYHSSSESSKYSEEVRILPDTVVNLICRSIGTQWKYLARNLNLQEGEIDEIEEKYQRSLKERAYECMKIFQKRADPYKTQMKLLDALEKSGRKDLREEVEELLNRRP